MKITVELEPHQTVWQYLLHHELPLPILTRLFLAELIDEDDARHHLQPDLIVAMVVGACLPMGGEVADSLFGQAY